MPLPRHIQIKSPKNNKRNYSTHRASDWRDNRPSSFRRLLSFCFTFLRCPMHNQTIQKLCLALYLLGLHQIPSHICPPRAFTTVEGLPRVHTGHKFRFSPFGLNQKKFFFSSKFLLSNHREHKNLFQKKNKTNEKSDTESSKKVQRANTRIPIACTVRCKLLTVRGD